MKSSTHKSIDVLVTENRTLRHRRYCNLIPRIEVHAYVTLDIVLLSLGLQHGEVEVDELEVAGGCGVVMPPQLCVEHLRH